MDILNFEPKIAPIRGWGGLSKMSKKSPKCPQLNYLNWVKIYLILVI